MNIDNVNIAEVVFSSVSISIACGSMLTGFYSQLGKVENRNLEMEIEEAFNATINEVKREAFMIGWSLARR